MSLSTRPKRLWRTHPEPPDSYFARMAAYPPIAARVLYNRGIRGPEEAKDFLDAALPAGESGSLLHEFRPAVERLAHAVERGERIAVYGDFDADGVTSAAILTKGLRGLGVTVMPYIPDRVAEGHGLNEGAVRLLAESGADLIVTADCGITDADEVALAAELGVDTIVTDHHSPPARLPDAAAVVNPKLPGQPAAYRELASCGVAYKLIEALYEHAGKTVGESLSGLAALGTIADMAPLTGGNRALVRHGIAALNGACDAGIKALIEVSRIRAGRVDAEAVSFSLAPRINAPGRMGHAEDGYKLLTAESADEAAALAKTLDAKNLERRTVTAAIVDKVLERRAAFESSPIIILGDADFPPGVVGLAAGRLTDQYYRPAIVCTTGPEETRGSCRSIPEFDMIEALRRVDGEAGGIFLRYGGHAQAAGFTVAADRFAELTERLTAVAAEELRGVELAPRLEIDAEVPLDRIDGATIKTLRRMEPYGQGNPPPTFLARGVEALDARPLGASGDHLRLKIRAGRVTWNAIYFNAAVPAEAARGALDLVFALKVDRFGEHETLRLEVLDLALHTAGVQTAML